MLPSGLSVQPPPLLEKLVPEIHSVTLYPMDGGRFKMMVSVNRQYSKVDTRLHTDKFGLACLVRKYLEDE